MARDCAFCDPARLPEARSLRTSSHGVQCYVFAPLNPVTPGHLLVVPRFHVNDAASHPRITAAVFEVASRIAAHVGPANLITSIGVPATQSVFHLHVHIVPRTEGDGLHLPWTGQVTDEVCSCGNRFDGDNLCMVSACEQER